MEFFEHIYEELKEPALLAAMVRVVVLLVGGVLFAQLMSAGTVRLLKGQLDAQAKMLVRRGIFYAIFSLSVVAAMYELGFKLDALLGAAGVISVAIGFASQTSMSNLISGLFLIGERAFSVGDVVEIGSTRGEVLSVDLLSVKLRTFDNLFVRIPNEQLIKAEVKNLSRFPIRRYDLALEVGFGTDLQQLQAVLDEVAEQSPLCLEEPGAEVELVRYGPQAIAVLFKTWTTKENYLAYRSAILREVKIALERAGIEVPLPQRVVHLARADMASQVVAGATASKGRR